MPKWLLTKLDQFYWSGSDEIGLLKRLVGHLLNSAKYQEWWQ